MTEATVFKFCAQVSQNRPLSEASALKQSIGIARVTWPSFQFLGPMVLLNGWRWTLQLLYAN